ncbi:MAG: hypothetical protein MUO19_09145 [Dehalococcoidales bacterium]|nr:hypothetical protein [Dehalococcoidales bacterium]
MADKTPQETREKQKSREVTFICQECQKPWDIKQMRRITRFRPILVVCPKCETKMR